MIKYLIIETTWLWTQQIRKLISQMTESKIFWAVRVVNSFNHIFVICFLFFFSFVFLEIAIHLLISSHHMLSYHIIWSSKSLILFFQNCWATWILHLQVIQSEILLHVFDLCSSRSVNLTHFFLYNSCLNEWNQSELTKWTEIINKSIINQ